MASAFAHVLVAVTLGNTLPGRYSSAKFWLLGSMCAVIPDADVIMFKFGVPYYHFLGHRGFSHSLVFAFLLALLVTFAFYRKTGLLRKEGLLLMLFFFLCTASHILLDALTNGGLGVAVFSPFHQERYFLPWRPISVSPFGIREFISARGWRILQNEFIWIGLPCFLWLTLVSISKIRKRQPLH